MGYLNFYPMFRPVVVYDSLYILVIRVWTVFKMFSLVDVPTRSDCVCSVLRAILPIFNCCGLLLDYYQTCCSANLIQEIEKGYKI